MTGAVVPRDERGRILKGHSLNPGGRTPVPAVLRGALDESGEVLVAIMRGEIKDPHVSRGDAAIEIINRQVPRPVAEVGAGGGERLQSLVDWLAGGDAPQIIDAEFEESTGEA